MNGAQQQALNALLSFTKLSRTIAGVLAAAYLIQLIAPASRQYTALVAGRFIPCAWSVFTAGILETHLLKVIVDVAGILVLAKAIEPLWGSKEFLKFLAAVNAATGVCTLVLVYLIFTLTQYSEHSGDLLYREIAGFEGVLAGCLVALKQIMPDNEVVILKLIRFRVKHLPSLFVLFAIVGSFIFGTKLSTIPFVLFGTYSAWIYLRFLQLKPELSVRGDPYNEDLSFASFFPGIVQPHVDRVADAVGKVLRMPPKSAAAVGESFMPGTTSLPGSDDADAARRRERGARALEERLGARKAVPAAAVMHDLESGTAQDSLAEPDGMSTS